MVSSAHYSLSTPYPLNTIDSQYDTTRTAYRSIRGNRFGSARAVERIFAPSTVTAASDSLMPCVFYSLPSFTAQCPQNVAGERREPFSLPVLLLNVVIFACKGRCSIQPRRDMLVQFGKQCVATIVDVSLSIPWVVLFAWNRIPIEAPVVLVDQRSSGVLYWAFCSFILFYVRSA